MKESQGKKAWYVRPWAIAIWVILAVPVLLSVIPLGSPDSEDDDAAHLSMHAGSIKANNSLSTGSSTSGTGTSFFSARHVVVMVRTDHKVARGVGRAVAKRLEDIDFIEQVDLLMPGEYPQPGQPAPDFLVMLEMPSFSASGLLATGRKVKAEVNVNLGRDPAHSNHTFVDQHAAPLARVNMNSSLEHESVSRGYETAAAKYHLVIENISEQLGGALEKNLRDWHGKYLVPGELPAGLMPAYVPPPNDLPLPEHVALEPLLSGNDLMMCNRSVWMMESAMPFDVLLNIHAQLLEEGWRVEPKTLKPQQYSCFFRAHKGADIFEGFEEPASRGIREADKPVRLVFRYLNRMEREYVLPVFDAMIADPDLPAETGLAFLSCMDSGQRARLLESWMDRPMLPFQASMAIVRELERSGKKDEALSRLQSLHAAALLLSGNEKDEVQKLGRKISGDKKWKPTLPTVEEFIAVGVQPIGTNTTIEVEVALNEVATFLAQSKDESDFALLSVAVKPSAIPEGLYTFEMSYRTGSELNSSGSSSSTAHLLEHPWKGQISHGVNECYFRAEATETGTNRFHIALEIQ